ncbi:MAG: hypothetical protein WDN09_03540 [bacterium]
MKYKIILFSALAIAVATFAGLYVNSKMKAQLETPHAVTEPATAPSEPDITPVASSVPKPTPPMPAPSITKFLDDFSTSYTVVETGDISESKSKEWWIGSGAYFYSQNGIASTVAGPLPEKDYFRTAFLASNPLDTDNGYYPQNIFRLVSRMEFQNLQQEAYFKITKDNLSASPNRNASNGLLLFNRYQDEFNLYYTGIRVDGYAVIKKKIDKTYYTMAYVPLFPGMYDNKKNPNLLPENSWIGLRSVVVTNADGTVTIKLYVDKDRTGKWVLAAQAEDDGKSYGGAPIKAAGYGGIRTDFMDVQFDDYSIVKL